MDVKSIPVERVVFRGRLYEVHRDAATGERLALVDGRKRLPMVLDPLGVEYFVFDAGRRGFGIRQIGRIRQLHGVLVEVES